VHQPAAVQVLRHSKHRLPTDSVTDFVTGFVTVLQRLPKPPPHQQTLARSYRGCSILLTKVSSQYLHFLPHLPQLIATG
jgi:hypothetical protein